MEISCVVSAHLRPIAGDQPLVEAVKCGRAVFSEALRSLIPASRRIAYPIFSVIRNDNATSSSIPSVARATAPGSAPERQERSLSQPRPVSVMRVSINTLQSLSVLCWKLLSKPTHVRQEMATHGPSLGAQEGRISGQIIFFKTAASQLVASMIDQL